MKRGLINGTNYEVEGKSKHALVFIHGLGLTKEMWQYQISYFRDKYCVLTYDLFGHGFSETSNSDPSLQVFTQQLKVLLDSLNLSKVVLIGFSLGGMVARHFARLHASRTQALVVLNSAHRREKLAQQAIVERYNKVLKFGPKSTVEDAIKRWFTPKFERHNKDKMDLVRSWILSNKPELYAKNYRVLVDEVGEVINKKNKISCPTLVVTADEDYGNGPDMAKAITDEIESAKLIILKGLRHMALFESPDEVNKKLGTFLSSVRMGE
jgi:pimeloyl-ACP methyl ester carboxylesterase